MARIDKTVDRNGVDLVGEDEYGRWFGTAASPVILGVSGAPPRKRRRRFLVTGYMGAVEFSSHVLTHFDESQLREHFRLSGVKDIAIF